MRNLALYLSLGLVMSFFWFAQHLMAGDKNKKATQSHEEKVKQALTRVDKPKAPKKKRTLLVFSVTKGYRHASIPTGKIALTLLGKESGAFEVVVSDDLNNFEKPNIDKFDAICFLNTTHEVFSDAADKEDVLKANLLNFIAEGKGFVGIHAATDTFFKWPAYGEMIGGYFDKHPWGANTEVVINVEKGTEKSPFNVGFTEGSVGFKEEVYQFKAPYDSKKLNMLLRLDTENSDMKVKNIKRTDGDFGVSWYKAHGKGRVFYCSLGHNHHIYWNSQVLSHYLAGIRYALGDLELAE